MNETIFVVVLVTYDYYRFQTNLAATRSFDQALQIAKAEAGKRSAHGEFTVTWSAEESANMDDQEKRHIWIEAFINIDVQKS